MIKASKKTRDDDFFKLEVNSNKSQKKKFKSQKNARAEIDINDIDITGMSASELAEMFADDLDE